MSEVPKLHRFNKKTGHPKWQFLFYIVLKKKVFLFTEGYPHDWCRRTMKKNYFAMKTNGIGWCSSKLDKYFHLGPIFYVCSSARNWVSFMYKGIYHIRNSLWQVAAPWMSEVPKLPRFNKKTGHPKWPVSFYIVFKKIVFLFTEGYPPRLVS